MPARVSSERSWIAGLGIFCAMTLAYGVFRWVYYHDLLPNTYYLKLTGVPLAVRLLRGMTVLTQFVRDHLAVLLVTGLGVGVLLKRNRRLILPAVIFALYYGPLPAAGVCVGNAWDGDLIRANRFIAFVVAALRAVQRHAQWRFPVEARRRSSRRRCISCHNHVAGMTVCSLFSGLNNDNKWILVPGTHKATDSVLMMEKDLVTKSDNMMMMTTTTAADDDDDGWMDGWMVDGDDGGWMMDG